MENKITPLETKDVLAYIDKTCKEVYASIIDSMVTETNLLSAKAVVTREELAHRYQIDYWVRVNDREYENTFYINEKKYKIGGWRKQYIDKLMELISDELTAGLLVDIRKGLDKL